MKMNERERLVELLNKSCEARGWLMNGAGTIADYLLENGVIVLPVKVGNAEEVQCGVMKMNAQEALETIKYEVDEEGHCGYIEDELRLAMTALEKQIPKKGIMIGDNYSSVLSCPNCRKPIVNVWNIAKYEPNYCHYCGQALDWSDTE